MPKDELFGMMMKLAERGLGKSSAGEGSPAARSVALLLTAIDNLSTAQQIDPDMSQSIQKAIDDLRVGIEGRVPKQEVFDYESQKESKKDEDSEEEDGNEGDEESEEEDEEDETNQKEITSKKGERREK